MHPQLFPIFREAQEQHPTVHANQGLVFNKWIKDWSRPSKGQVELDKQMFISRWDGKVVGDQALFAHYQQRMERLVKQQNGFSLIMENIDPLITGMGLSHPLENGLLWHHNLGAPYIPGSSFKGVLRHWLTVWNQVGGETVEQVFGKEAPKHQVGGTLFFDVLPIQPVKLQAEIMTPHFTDTPDERSEPVPIPFLTVAPKQRFLFSIAPRKGADQWEKEKLQTWIMEALSTIGVGAKTAVGYGIFEQRT